MKNFLLSVLFAGATIAASAGTTVPQKAMSFPNVSFQKAMDKNGEYLPMTFEYQGDNVKVTIYEANLTTIRKQFVLNNVNVSGDNFDKSIEGLYPWGAISQYDTRGIQASQNIYNTDDKWEFIIRTDKMETVTEGDYTYDNWKSTYEVINENNEFVCYPMLDGGNSYAEPSEFVKLGNEYLLVELAGDVNDEYHTYNLYRYVAGTPSAVTSVKADAKASRAYPNPLPSGHTLTIEFDEPASTGTTVEVFNSAGMKVYSAPVSEGENKTYVPSRRIRNGNFIYVINRGGQTVERGKIIAQ